jgi:FKBP-type peptidyl-prolyl cis-trans isomerase
MYEPLPQLKTPRYVWYLVGLLVACVGLLAYSFLRESSASKDAEAVLAGHSVAAKHAESLVALEASASARERSLLTQIETLSTALKNASSNHVTSASKLIALESAERNSALVLSQANNRINELNAELASLRNGSELKEALALRRKAESDLESASAALREANAKLAASMARIAEFEEENRRLRLSLIEATGEASGRPKTIRAVPEGWIKLNEEYLRRLDADSTITKSASGLRYKIIVPGGPARPYASSTVKCLYEGRLVDGKIFDSTNNRNNQPSEFPLNAVIPSWTEGLQLIGPGGKIILYSPSSLAYGDEGQGPIPGKSVLVFEVELVDVSKY